MLLISEMWEEGKQEQSLPVNSLNILQNILLIHLDIAGTEMLKKDDYYRLKNGPASGLRLLSTFLRKIAAKY